MDILPSQPDNDLSEADDGAVFDGLPDDLSYQILARIPFASQSSAKAVCKAWLNALSSGTTYEVLTRTQAPSMQLCDCLVDEKIIEETPHAANDNEYTRNTYPFAVVMEFMIQQTHMYISPPTFSNVFKVLCPQSFAVV